jgi:hypothetical protein
VAIQTSWGSRADGDANDAQRLAPAPSPSKVLTTPRGAKSLIRFNVRQKGGLTSTRTEQDSAWEKRDCAVYESGTSYPEKQHEVTGMLNIREQPQSMHFSNPSQ